MQSIGDILKSKIEKFKQNPLDALKFYGKEYQKKWNEGVNYFLIEINKDRKKEGLEDLSFIAVRQKLVALKEINDLRWFYYQCKKYAQTKDKQGGQNSFSKCFWGALK